MQENVGNFRLEEDANQKISGERNFKVWLALSEREDSPRPEESVLGKIGTTKGENRAE